MNQEYLKIGYTPPKDEMDGIIVVEKHDYMFLNDMYAICTKDGTPFTSFKSYRDWFRNNSSETRPIQYWAKYYQGTVKELLANLPTNETYTDLIYNPVSGEKELKTFPIPDKLKQQRAEEREMLTKALDGFFPMKFKANL